MEKQATSQAASTDEAVLLRDWDIERFFSNDRNKKSSPNLQKSNVIAVQSNKDAQKPKSNEFAIDRNISSKNPDQTAEQSGKPQVQASITNARLKSNFLSNFLENAKNAKRQENESKLPSNFIRGFRREHSDFFPSSKRHSVVLGERQSAISHIVPHRSSAIYTKHNKNNNGEPILTDFVSRAYLENSPSSSLATKPTTTTATTTTSATPITTSASAIAIANNKCNSNSNDSNVNNNRNLFSMGPRREKTESVISLRNSANRNLLFDQLQVKPPFYKHKNQQPIQPANNKALLLSSYVYLRANIKSNQITAFHKIHFCSICATFYILY